MKTTGHIEGKQFCKRAGWNGVCWLLKAPWEVEKTLGGGNGGDGDDSS